ncbi:hypothetical protein BDV98DRAFT_517859 [Pterulicium gracile]|uniref:Multidrug resistance-associated ABC transporter n=1 Tax=Pterulicium gracile TaxID=1884261 RepID=A0A5C3Q4J6_9AGAR|nr:hypothetical protein BDV98DRAFT_517859 [Pterula gracilis]
MGVKEAEEALLDESKINSDSSSSTTIKRQTHHPQTHWKPYLTSFLALLQSLVWSALSAYFLAFPSSNRTWLKIGPAALAPLSALTFLLIALFPAFAPNPRRIAQPGHALLTAALFLASVVRFGGRIYDVAVTGTSDSEEEYHWVWAAEVGGMLASGGMASVVFSMPMDVSGEGVKLVRPGSDASPEDYCSLWQWLTFGWVYPLIRKGRTGTLNEDDVWRLSPTMQSRLIYTRFMNDVNLSLMRRIWDCNAFDVLAQFVLVYIGVIFQFAGPFFLRYYRKILSAIDSPESDGSIRPTVYLLALAAFLAQVLKSETDLQHLWVSRRISTRVRTELMAAIYDKSLKRRDFSGAKAKKEAEEAENEPKAGADTGKIVNLMATDAATIASLFEGMYLFYAAPLQLVIAALMLYQLLGACGFIGFLILVLFIPLNKFLFSLTVSINKGLTSARDTRMAVLTEMIGSIKFIKFFAWEGQWVKRVEEKRAVEMGWLVKSRWTWLALDTVWSLPPALVSVTSFLVYVALGNQLTISTAFTSLSLFAMIQQPLTFISYFIVRLIQTKVSLQRIAQFLEEDEVSAQVSSLKLVESSTTSNGSDEGLGIERGCFKWNEVEEPTSDSGSESPASDSSESVPGSSDGDLLHVRTASTSTAGVAAQFELRDIDVMFPEGELTVVTGPTASGKTALLLAVLGEMTTLSGRIVMSKRPNVPVANSAGITQGISYAAQAPWLRHQSIRENIVFDSPFDEARYDDVVRCCALGPDFDILEDGDDTEIGAKGVSLSGGQKARVALARAVYARTKYVLLDDPLSAVDSHTARLLFEKLLCGPLLKGRTVILVTHHVELVLPGAQYLVRMLDGRVDAQGTIKDLRAQGLIDEIKEESAAVAQAKEENVVVPEHAMAGVETRVEPTADTPVDVQPKEKKGKGKARKLVEDEHREVGSVKWSIYKTYLKASTYWIWAGILMFIALFQANSLLEKYWIKRWGEAYSVVNQTVTGYGSVNLQQDVFSVARSSMHTRNTPFDVVNFFVSRDTQNSFGPNFSTQADQLPDASAHPFFYIGVYAALATLSALLRTLAAGGEYIAATIAGKRLFKELLTKIVKATMRWYDTTPSGRILNRFGKDIETLDDGVAQSIWIVNVETMGLVIIIAMISSIFPLFIIPAVIIGYLYFDLAVGYLNTGRDLRRMESNTRSPIFSDFSEVLEGIVTVRAFSAERRFLHNMHKKIDLTTKMNYMTWMTNRWLLIRFDVLGGFTVFLTTLFAVSGYVSAGTAGLCITSATSFTMSVYWLCRFWTKMASRFLSVERIVEYLDVPEEPAAIIESNRPPAYWPSSTTQQPLVRVEDLNIKYAPDLPSVIHNISFELKAGERVGLLGRTGGGKSTLAMSMLRFVDPAGGRIVIDGTDISKIGVQDLRSRLTFIPQDAALFSGTVRDNLDPLKEHDDGDCLDALHRVHMLSDDELASQHPSRAPSISTTPRANTPEPPSPRASDRDTDTLRVLDTSSVLGAPRISLSTLVSASGTNFSQGQRQLLAMARALLRRSAIVILDEATSSIDFKTDEKIQSAIRQEFVGALLITIAHRLRTVVDYDRLIVLDKGKVVEFDTPHALITKEGGIFRDMCLKSGSFGELLAVATNSAGDASTGTDVS